MEFINTDFLNMKNCKADCIFLSLDWNFYDNKFSLFNNLNCEISKILNKSFEMTKNIVLSLPKSIKISELAKAFSNLTKEFKF